MLKASLIGFYDFKDDPWGTIEKLSKWGYKAYESASFLLDGDTDANIAKLESCGMRALSIGAELWELDTKLDEVIAKAHRAKVEYVCCYWSDAQTYEEALGVARILERAGEQLRWEKLCLCYHNHDHEFRRSFHGVRYFDILLANTSDDNLCLNLDIGWVTVGGEDVPALMKRLGSRIKLMHFKDFYDLGDRASFTTLGTGKVDIQGLLKAADELGIEYISVEQDTLRNLDCDSTVLCSYLTLKESGLVE